MPLSNIIFDFVIHFPGMKELVCLGESEQELDFALRGPVDHYGGSPQPKHLRNTFT